MELWKYVVIGFLSLFGIVGNIIVFASCSGKTLLELKHEQFMLESEMKERVRKIKYRKKKETAIKKAYRKITS